MDTRGWLALGLVVVISLLLLLPRLGSSCLDGEEASIALLAQSVLERGYPYAETRLGLVTQEWGRDANRYGVWVLTPWLPIYLCAASFKVFGVSSYAARLPFAFAGVLSAVLLFVAARRMHYNTMCSFLIALLLVGNVQFLLFSRRAGPHGLAILFATLILLECLRSRFQEPPGITRNTFLRTALWCGILFYVDYWIWLLQVAALLAYWLSWYWLRNQSRERREVASVLPAAMAFGSSICLALPFIIYVACSGGLPVKILSAGELPAVYRVMYPIGGIWEASQFLMGPLLLLCALSLLFTGARPVCNKVSLFTWSSIVGTLAAYTILLKLVSLPSRYLYVAHLVPSFTILCAQSFFGLAARSKSLAAAAALLLWFTNVGEIWLPWLGGLDATNRHFVPPKWKSYQIEYLMELSQGYKGPVDRLVEYLSERRKDAKTVFASYEVEPLMFHLQIAPVRMLPLPLVPDAVILRAGWECDYDKVLVRSAWKQTTDSYHISWQRAAAGCVVDIHCAYLRRFITATGYTHVVLPPADYCYQNSDETRTRYFCPDDALRRVDLWLRGGL